MDGTGMTGELRFSDPFRINEWNELVLWLKDHFEKEELRKVVYFLKDDNSMEVDDENKGPENNVSMEVDDENNEKTWDTFFYHTVDGGKDKLQAALKLQEAIEYLQLHHGLGENVTEKIQTFIDRLRKYQKGFEVETKQLLFIGRETELEILMDLINHNDVNIEKDNVNVFAVSICGIGGQGKSLLARQVCLKLGQADGVSSWSVVKADLRMVRKKYDEASMKMAISAVKQNKMKIRKAAAEYCVPKSTLFDRIRGRYETSVKGPSRQITPEEEAGLVNYLLHMANQGFPLNRQMTRAYIQTIVKRSGRTTLFNLDKGPSNQWLKKFIQRHPELSERKPENSDKARCSMSNRKVMADFFVLLDDILGKYGVKDKPSQIFNCDETGFSGRETARSKVIGPKKGHVFRRRVTTTDHITAHLCVCADGRFLPTMVIYQGSLPHRNYTDGIPDCWGYATSENGYMDTQLFQRWFADFFIPNCGRERPVVLLMDNCDAHISGEVVKTAIANDVVLVGLPGHTTHILQPLDVKVIGPLKSRFSEMTSRLGLGGAGVSIGKAKFPIVLKHAIDSATPASVQEAFAVTGICPYNPQAIDTTQLVEASFDQRNGENESDEQVKTCDKCGHFLSNPLVKRGLIPASLADVLMPPPVKPAEAKRKKRVVAEGRLISGEEMLKQLKEKEDLEKKKVEDIERRKKEREMKKEKRLEEEEERRAKKKKREEEKELKINEKRRKVEQRKEKRKEKEANSAAAAALMAGMYVCEVCGLHGLVDDEVNGRFWFGCDEELCQRWYHEECLTDCERMYVRESLEEGGDKWFCKRCKPWLYEEE